MPYDTKDSRRSMGMLLTHGSKNYSSVQITQINFPHPEKIFNGEYFNLPLWMFDSPSALDHPWKTGDIIEMRSVPEKLADKFSTEIRRDLAEQWRLLK
jgi:hypothetical protein